MSNFGTLMTHIEKHPPPFPHISHLHTQGRNNLSPIHLAIQIGQISHCITLIKYDPTILEIRDQYGRDAYHYMVLFWDSEWVEELIDGLEGVQGVEHVWERVERVRKCGGKRFVEEMVDFGTYDVFLAASEGHLGFLGKVLKGREEVDQKDLWGRTMMHYASRNGREEVVRFLLGIGCSVNVEDDERWTPLMWAVNGEHLGVARLVLEGSSVDSLRKALSLARSDEVRGVIEEALASVVEEDSSEEVEEIGDYDVDVCIIGSGFAGLSVAYELWKQKVPVNITILEARERIGGRVWSYEGLSSTNNHFSIDLGGEFLHECCMENPVRKLCSELQIPLERWVQERDSSEETVFDFDGSQIPDKIYDEAEKVYSRLENLYNRDDGIPRTMEEVLKKDPRFEGCEKCETQLQRAFSLVVKEIEGWEGGTIETLSVFDEYVGFEGGDAYVRGGYGAILKKLYEIFAPNIQFSSVVTDIEYSEDGVNVHINNGDVKSFDYCVCTVSLGVLQGKSINFDPPLSQAKQLAIDRSGFGLLNKVVLRFPNNFWKLDIFTYAAKDSERMKLCYDLSEYKNEPVLLIYYCGTAAFWVENADDDLIIADIMDTLQILFPDEAEPPVDYAIARWNSDPFAKGSYTYFKIGSEPEDFDNISIPDPDNRLYFAGEGTSTRYYSTVHGAWLTGIREANRIQRSLSTTTTLCNHYSNTGHLCPEPTKSTYCKNHQD